MGLRRLEPALSSTVKRTMFSPSGQGGSGGGTGVSLPVTANVQAWFRADAGTFTDTNFATPTTADGDVVGGWQDQGPLGVNVTQGTGSRKPLWILNAQNNLPAVRFDGVNDFMTVVFAAVVAQQTNYYLVAKMTSTTGMFFSSSVESDPNRQRLMKFTGPVWLFGAGSNISGGTPDTNLHQLTMIFAGASSVLYVDGVSTLVGNPSSGGQAGLTFGASAGGGSLVAALDLFELIMYRGTQTTAERLAIQNYLKARWATP